MNDLFGSAASAPRSAKQFDFIEIAKPVAASIYRNHHYFGEKDFLNMYSFGALHEGEIWAAISYGIPNAKNINGLYTSDQQSGVLEIVRLACHPDCPRFTPSRMISQSIKILRKKYPLRLVITYADTAQNHEGTIYKASNFRYHGLTAKKTDFLHADGTIKKLKGVKYSELEGEWIERSQKHLYSMSIK